jgi:hypothetical protein
VACTPEVTCPFSAVNALSTGIGNIYYDSGYGGSNAGVTCRWETNTSPSYVVHGTHWCATNNGTYAVKGTPSGSSGQYCWCKLLDINNDSCAGSWVFNDAFGSASSCSNYCANYCAYVRSYSAFRSAVVSLENTTYRIFINASSCPAGYVAIPSNVGTVAENGVACTNGTCDISCTWQ